MRCVIPCLMFCGGNLQAFSKFARTLNRESCGSEISRWSDCVRIEKIRAWVDAVGSDLMLLLSWSVVVLDVIATDALGVNCGTGLVR